MPNKIPINDILEGKYPSYSRGHLKKRIIKHNIIPYHCNSCGLIPTWNGKSLGLVLDHINGVNDDHRLENLQFLCPNCNSQTDTFCGKNIRRVRRELKNKDLIQALNNSYSIGAALKHLGVLQNGHYYRRSKELLAGNKAALAVRSVRKKVLHRRCLFCSNSFIYTVKNKKQKYCSKECAHAVRERIQWPDISTLMQMVNETSYTATGKLLKVSDNAIRKRIKNHS